MKTGLTAQISHANLILPRRIQGKFRYHNKSQQQYRQISINNGQNSKSNKSNENSEKKTKKNKQTNKTNARI